MVAAKTPNLAKIKNEASETDARALLYIAVCEVCNFFNVGKNMNDTQIALTVDLILESFWHLRLEEVKYCFRRAMMREKLFDRLDGNIILGWLREYDAERTEEAMRISEREETLPTLCEPETVSYDEYLSALKRRAASDRRAAEILETATNPPERGLTSLSAEDSDRDEAEFKRWFYREYLRKRPEGAAKRQDRK